MEISIPKRTSKNTTILIKNSLIWLGDALLGKKLAKNIFVAVTFESVNVMAYTTWEDNNIRPREFSIVLNKSLKPNMQMLVTLTHEMIHVMQFAKGDLQDTKFPHLKKWRGELITIDNKNSNKTVAPWEIEAEDMEYIILSDLVAAIGQKIVEIPL